MKTLLTFAFALLCFSACKKSSPTPYNQISIVGRWKHTKDIVINSPSGIIDTAEYNDPNDYFQFNANGTGTISEEFYTSTGAKTYNTFAIAYTVSGSSLTLNANGNSEIDVIKTLTSSSLVIHAEYKNDDSTIDKADEYFIK